MADGVRQRSVAGNESKKPDNSAFKQQRLPAWQPVLTAKSVLPIFAIVGLIFIPVGVLIIVASNTVKEHEVMYTKCIAQKYWFDQTNKIDGDGIKTCTEIYDEWRKALGDEIITNVDPPTCTCYIPFTVDEDMKNPVFAYYRLTDYYQNHRRYVKSRDDVQLLANEKDLVNPSQDCQPYDTIKTDDGNIPIAPCGAIANSLFNDTFFIISCPDGVCPALTDANLDDPKDIDNRLTLSGKNIAWSTDKTQKFDPDNKTGNGTYMAGTAKPLNWRTEVATLGTENDALKYRFQSGTNGIGFQNEDFIVWMRTAAFPTFRKLYRKMDTEVKGGNYSLLIYYNYPVHSFGGGKYFVLATTSWIGGKNFFLGYTYTIVGALCFIVMFVLLCISKRNNND